MRREPGWRERLTDVVKRYDGDAFEWGRSDCAHFARDCVLAVSGKNILQFGFDGNYTNRVAFRIRLKRNGFRSIEAATEDAMKRLDFAEIPPRFSIEGDLGITADDVLAIRFATGFIARDEDGNFRTAKVRRAWRID